MIFILADIGPVTNISIIVDEDHRILNWSGPPVPYCINLVYCINIESKVMNICVSNTHLNLLDFITFDPCLVINVSITATGSVNNELTSNGVEWSGSLPDC